MSKNLSLPYGFHWSSEYAHIAWADIAGNGLLVEVAVVALDERNGDLYYIPINNLDKIDQERLLKIITKRDAQKYPLWDLMSNTTLKNGINSLEYFQQLVKGRSLSGQIFKPGQGKIGLGGQISSRPTTVQNGQLPAQTLVAPQAPIAPVVAKKGPGRPPAVK
jgi:hypothetical protein